VARDQVLADNTSGTQFLENLSHTSSGEMRIFGHKGHPKDGA
jgi:hypothetical protein